MTGFGQLVAARAAMSFAEGCFNPSAYPLLTDTVPKARHGLALGLMSLTYPVGTASALIVASVVGTAYWRQPFLVFGLIGIALGIVVLLFVREPKRGATEEVRGAPRAPTPGAFRWRRCARPSPRRAPCWSSRWIPARPR